MQSKSAPLFIMYTFLPHTLSRCNAFATYILKRQENEPKLTYMHVIYAYNIYFKNS